MEATRGERQEEDSAGEQQGGIAGLRQSLDEVDRGIVGLIARRSSLIADIAALKGRGAAALQDADRERRVLDGVEAVATDLGVSASLVRRIFRELISDSVAQQARHLHGDAGGRVKVAFQGTAHAYSDAAARKYLAGRGLDGDLAGHRTSRERNPQSSVRHGGTDGRSCNVVLPLTKGVHGQCTGERQSVFLAQT